MNVFFSEHSVPEHSVTSANKAEVCDHSVNRLTDERGNGRQPNLAGVGKG